MQLGSGVGDGASQMKTGPSVSRGECPGSRGPHASANGWRMWWHLGGRRPTLHRPVALTVIVFHRLMAELMLPDGKPFVFETLGGVALAAAMSLSFSR